MSANDLIFACDGVLAAVTEGKNNAVRLAQLGQQIQAAQGTLAALQGQIEQAKKGAAELEKLDQQIRARRSELADLDAIIQKKHLDHGSITSALRDLRKQITGDRQHA
jgi:chromosome segregation ATPase